MFAALVLAAAMQTDTYTDDAGCRWKRRPPAAAKSASGVKPKAKHPAKAKPKQPDDEFIGCDPDGYGVWKSDLEDVPTMATEIFVPIEMIMDVDTYEAPLELVPPVSFEQACDCDVAGYPVFVGQPIFVGGGGGFVQLPPTVPVPEGPTWLMLLVGAIALRLRRAN